MSVHQDLFHVSSDDLDDETGIRLDELLVLRQIAGNPWVLKFERLENIIKMFIRDDLHF